MAYALSFAEAFFWGDGTVPPEELPPSDQPTNVYQALRSLPPEQWAALARDVFAVEPEHLDIETVLTKVIETDTCSNLDGPAIDIWIDDEGWYRILIYESERSEL